MLDLLMLAVDIQYARALINVGLPLYQLDCLGRRGIAMITILRSLDNNPIAQTVLAAGVSGEMIARHFSGHHDPRVSAFGDRLTAAGFSLPD